MVIQLIYNRYPEIWEQLHDLILAMLFRELSGAADQPMVKYTCPNCGEYHISDEDLNFIPQSSN